MKIANPIAGDKLGEYRKNTILVLGILEKISQAGFWKSTTWDAWSDWLSEQTI